LEAWEELVELAALGESAALVESAALAELAELAVLEEPVELAELAELVVAVAPRVPRAETPGRTTLRIEAERRTATAQPLTSLVGPRAAMLAQARAIAGPVSVLVVVASAIALRAETLAVAGAVRGRARALATVDRAALEAEQVAQVAIVSAIEASRARVV